MAFSASRVAVLWILRGEPNNVGLGLVMALIMFVGLRRDRTECGLVMMIRVVGGTAAHMNTFKKIGRLCVVTFVMEACALAGTVSSANAIGGPTLTFQELDKGGTVNFVDNPPEATLKHGVVSFSPGDMLITTNPLAMEGKVVGKIRIVCTATSAGDTKHPAEAGLACTGIARIPGGSLVLVAELSEGATEGAVTGGTGVYAGADGTFISRRGRHSTTTVVTLLE